MSAGKGYDGYDVWPSDVAPRLGEVAQRRPGTYLLSPVFKREEYLRHKEFYDSLLWYTGPQAGPYFILEGSTLYKEARLSFR